MADSMVELEESLECPVCYNIPRDVPIPCCEAGHIVCQDCRRRLMVCPTCRGRLESNTNSLAARQVMLVRHKCKFSFYGCDVKMKLKEIVNHEKHCPERTITCPHRKCREEFQLKKFNEHSIQTGCAKNSINCRNGQNIGYCTDAPSGFPRADTYWSFSQFEAHQLSFYLAMSYLASKQSFILRVFLPEGVESASKYTTRITVSPSTTRKLFYEGPVLSIEDLPDENSSQVYDKYWIVSCDVMRPFINFSTNGGRKEAKFDVGVEVLKSDDNYGLDDLRSDSETDSEVNPKKQIPKWAEGTQLRTALLKQFYKDPDVDKIFSRRIEDPDLSLMFNQQKKRYFKRTSSACWDSAPQSFKFKRV